LRKLYKKQDLKKNWKVRPLRLILETQVRSERVVRTRFLAKTSRFKIGKRRAVTINKEKMLLSLSKNYN